MSAEWKVGITNSGLFVFHDDTAWRWVEFRDPIREPLNVRPLVLIDPEDEKQVERLHALYATAEPGGGSRGSDYLSHALREYASPTPPKPDEPMGLGAVVVDTDGVKWVHADCASPPWLRENGIGDAWRNYADISAVEVLSAGVES